MSLEDLIGKEKLELLKRKHPSLDQLFYVCACETCGKQFFKATLSKVQKMLLSGEWDPHKPMPWYCDAAEHYLDLPFHSVRVFITDGSEDKSLVKDVSKDIKALLITLEARGFNEEHLRATIKRLRKGK